MDRGLYIAATGMLAELARQERIANDLANASTPGYKPEQAGQGSFGELLLVNSRTGAFVGPAGLGVTEQRERLDLSQGPLRDTGEPLDIALDGAGFLAVETPQGVRYTRNGQLRLDPEGRLATAAGLPVLGADGKPIAAGGKGAIEIDERGVVRAGGREVGTLAVVGLDGTAKAGDGLFEGTPVKADATTGVRQGYLEGSSVNAAETMVDMIVSMRAFEAGQRVIHAIDDTIGRAIQASGSGS
jgi:flagellar basal-body rod protein FlgG